MKPPPTLIAVMFVLLGIANIAPAAEPAQKKILLIGDAPDGHPATTHEYLAGVRIMGHLLRQFPTLEVSSSNAAGEWPEGPQLIREADGVFLFVSEGASWVTKQPRRFEALAALAQRGGGLVALHWSIGSKDERNIASYLKLFGGCHGGPDRKYKILETELMPGKSAEGQPHPITTGIAPFTHKDEFYYRLKFISPPEKQPGIVPVLTAKIDGENQTVAWSWTRPDGGHSFGFSGMHFHNGWKLPEYRRLMTQAVLWTVKEPIPDGGVNVDVPAEVLELSKK